MIAAVAQRDALGALESEWWSLWERSPSASPFTTPAWLLPWWDAFGHGTLHVLAARESGALVALLPAFVEPLAGRRTRLSLIGTGNSDRLGALVAPGAEDALDEVLERALDVTGQAEFEQLAADDPLVRARAPAGAADAALCQDACPVVALPRDADAFLATLSARFRARLTGRYPRRLAALGRFEHVIASSAEIEEFVAALCRLHEERQAVAGAPGALATAPSRSFLHRAAPALHRRGLLRLHALRLDGRPVAVLAAFHAKGRAYAWLSGFDPALESFSPGAFVVWCAVRAAIEEGLAEFDFLRGREPYKYLWGAVDRWNLKRVIQR